MENNAFFIFLDLKFHVSFIFIRCIFNNPFKFIHFIQTMDQCVNKTGLPPNFNSQVLKHIFFFLFSSTFPCLVFS